MLDLALAVVGLLALALATSSRWLDRAPVSGPLLALVTGVLIGPRVTGLLDLPPAETPAILHTAARLTLAVSLMAVALRFPARTLWIRRRQLLALLAVVLPVMALVTAGLAAITLGVGAGLALVLGAVLAPTDPVLASSVISGAPAEATVPERLRQDLSLESGANDGLALPLVVLAVPLVTGTAVGTAALEALWGVAGAAVVGTVLGWGAGRLLVAAEANGAVDLSHVSTYSLVLALAGLGVGTLLHTDGLLLVFVSGVVFNAGISHRDRATEELVDEGVHRLLILPLFVLLGTALPWTGWGDLGAGGVALALGVLLLRRLPWIVALRRPLHYGAAEAVWLGWFGPIGVAAVYYLTELTHRGVFEPFLFAAGTLVVTASTVVHGVTASPGVRWLGEALRRRSPAG